MEEYDSRQDTLDHISTVNFFLNIIIKELQQRALYHDLSKLNQPEKKCFDKFTPLLRDTTYNSDKYKSFLAEMKPALEHHYAHNRHHPEHNEKSNVSMMNLIDVIEMFCDWKAATIRHDNGNLKRSILVNQKRFNISDELTAVFLNTIKLLGHMK